LNSDYLVESSRFCGTVDTFMSSLSKSELPFGFLYGYTLPIPGISYASMVRMTQGVHLAHAKVTIDQRELELVPTLVG